MKILEQVIAINRIQCTKCKDIIVSEYGHDFKYCKCGWVAVDGGHNYLRRCGDIDNYIELSEYGYRVRVITDSMKDMYRDMEKRGDAIKILED